MAGGYPVTGAIPQLPPVWTAAVETGYAAGIKRKWAGPADGMMMRMPVRAARQHVIHWKIRKGPGS